MLAQLSDRARSEGIRRFTALVSASNAAMAGLLRNMRADLVARGPGTVEYQITVAPSEEDSHSWLAPVPDDLPARGKPAGTRIRGITMRTKMRQPTPAEAMEGGHHAQDNRSHLLPDAG